MKHLAVAIIAAGVGLAGSGPTYAQVYKKVMPDGTVVFTDEPTEGAQTINIAPLPTISLPSDKSKSGKDAKGGKDGKAPETAKTAATKFNTFAITAPTQDSSIRANNGAVPVTINVEPPLDPKKGHTIVLILDGKPVGQPAAQTSFTLEGVDRGSHTVGAEIRDGSGGLAATANPVIFHVQRHAVAR